MREILFQGKRLDTGKWVEGYLLKTKGYTHIMYPDQFADDLFFSPENIIYAVESRTVGQFTGRLDIHDKRIFEGHIVRFYRTNSLGRTTVRVVRVAFDTYNGTPAFCVIDPTGYRWSFAALGEVEIIGNIYDNPELMKGGGSDA